MANRVALLGTSLFVFVGTSALASSFDRPIPQPQSEMTELWFALASLLLCVALYAVHRVVKRR